MREDIKKFIKEHPNITRIIWAFSIVVQQAIFIVVANAISITMAKSQNMQVAYFIGIWIFVNLFSLANELHDTFGKGKYGLS